MPPPLKEGRLCMIALADIAPRPDQPRRTIDPAGLEELTRSILEHGVLQPIRVRALGEGYEIIAGERRWRAARQARLREIPAIIAEADDDEAFVEALIENIQREDLNAVDRAQALKRLRVHLGAHSWAEVGEVIGIHRRHVYHLLNVTRLPEAIQDDIRVGDLTEKHGRALLSLRASPVQQIELWERIHCDDLSGDAAIAAAKALRTAAGARGETVARRGSAATLERSVDHLLEVIDSATAEEILATRRRLDHLRQRLAELLQERAP
jgi:ParB family chromosome partitioning protein